MSKESFVAGLRRRARPILAVYWVMLATATHWPHLSFGSSEKAVTDYISPDKIGHFGMWVLLTLLLYWAAPAGRRASRAVNLMAAAAIAVLYGFVDEFTQDWSPERTAALDDAMADVLGATGVFLAILLHHAYHDRSSRWVLAARVLLGLALPVACVVFLMEGFSFTLPLGAVRWLGAILPGWLSQLRADHVGHFIMATWLTWLLIAARPLGERRRWLSTFFAVALAGALGPAIEYAQLFFHRGFEAADIQSHQLGVAAATVLWTLAMLLRWSFTYRGRPMTVGSAALAAADSGASSADNDAAPPAVPPAAPAPAAETTSVSGSSEASGSSAAIEGESGGGEASGGDTGGGGFVGHAMLVAVLTFLSRITGLVRDAVLAAAFGLGPVSDAFFIGFLVPNLFRRLFGEGALTAAFIPSYTDLLHKDRLTARRLASLCVAMMMVVLGGMTIVGEAVLAGMLAAHDWSGQSSMAIRLTMIMLPYMPMICLVAMLGGVLQVHGRFGPPAAAPILLNLVMITAAALVAFGGDHEASVRHAVTVVSWSVLAAGLCQLVWQVAAVLRVESFTTVFTGAWPALRGMMLMMGPMLIGLAVFQINTFLDSLIAFSLSPKDGAGKLLNLFGWHVAYPIEPGGVAALQWSQRLYQFPLGVFGLAIATAIFPALARAAAAPGEAGLEQLRHILRRGLRLTAFIGLPASVGLIIIRLPLARVIYERGEFRFQDSLRVASILAGYSSAVWAYSMTHVVTRAFYAMKDSRTPLVISTVMVIFNLVLNLTLVWSLGVAGLAWSSAACAMGQVTLLLLAIRRYVDTPVDAGVWRSWGRTLLLSLFMAAALVPIIVMRPPAEADWGGAAELLVVLVGLGLVVFAGGAWALGAEELTWLVRRRGAW